MTTGPATEHFFLLGMQYYATGRYSALAGLAPVCGNLLHHAIEMFLKGALSKKLTLKELKDIRHSLEQLWERFKSEAGDVTLGRFDETVIELDKFETIRYPNRVLREGMEILIDVVDNVPFPSSNPLRPEPRFHVVLCKVDELVTVIFTKASINPKFFLSSFLRPESREYLAKENLYPLDKDI